LWQKLKRGLSWARRVETGEVARGIPDVLAIFTEPAALVFIELKVGKPQFRPGQVAVGKKLDEVALALVLIDTGACWRACRFRNVDSDGILLRPVELVELTEREIWSKLS
jgi:hypothetical protein